MKFKFIAMLLLSPLLINISLAAEPDDQLSSAAEPGDLLYSYKSLPTDNVKIYDNFIKGIKEITENQPKPRTYHATVAWVADAKNKAKNYPKLKQMMDAQFRSINSVDYNFGQAIIYRNSPTCPDGKNPLPGKKCSQAAIVLVPNQQTETALKQINKKFSDVLEEYNKAYEDPLHPLTMRADVDTKNYVPHMTLSNTGQVKSDDRAIAVKQVNANIEKHGATKLNDFVSVKVCNDIKNVKNCR